MTTTATAAAHPNLAFVKYWGRRDVALNIPANGSISINLSGATTTTTVIYDPELHQDTMTLNNQPADEKTLRRVQAHMDRVRVLSGIGVHARITSWNDFPADVGVASSASAFAALSLAATAAAGLSLDEPALSRLARWGSGSACRSVPSGFVEWLPGRDDASSYARSIAPSHHWDLRVVTVAVSHKAKQVSSIEGHRAAPTSPFYSSRLREVVRRLSVVREAILSRDFSALSVAAEQDALSLHAVAMTSRTEVAPWLNGILYFAPETVRLLDAVPRWRRQGLPVAFTLDAGPSVHLICEAAVLEDVCRAVMELPMSELVTTIVSRPGRGAWLIQEKTDGAEAPSVLSCED